MVGRRILPVRPITENTQEGSWGGGGGGGGASFCHFPAGKFFLPVLVSPKSGLGQSEPWQTRGINPITASDCSISGLNDAARTRLQTVYFPVLYNTSTFSVVCFDENPFTRQLKKKKKKKRRRRKKKKGLQDTNFALLLVVFE